MKTACLVIALALMIMTVASSRYRRVRSRRTRKVYEDPNPCDQVCYDRCCERGDCSERETNYICATFCGCRERTLEDANPCDQACHDRCCEGECGTDSNLKAVCDRKCGCRKRTLEALKTKRGDEEYPIDTEYAHVSPEECATCKETCTHSDAVCSEICGC